MALERAWKIRPFSVRQIKFRRPLRFLPLALNFALNPKLVRVPSSEGYNSTVGFEFSGMINPPPVIKSPWGLYNVAISFFFNFSGVIVTNYNFDTKGSGIVISDK